MKFLSCRLFQRGFLLCLSECFIYWRMTENYITHVHCVSMSVLYQQQAIPNTMMVSNRKQLQVSGKCIKNHNFKQGNSIKLSKLHQILIWCLQYSPCSPFSHTIISFCIKLNSPHNIFFSFVAGCALHSPAKKDVQFHWAP